MDKLYQALLAALSDLQSAASIARDVHYPDFSRVDAHVTGVGVLVDMVRPPAPASVAPAQPPPTGAATPPVQGAPTTTSAGGK
jgi:hypothetical protein